MRKSTKTVAYISAGVFMALVVALAGCRQGAKGQAPRNPLATAEETVRAYAGLDASGARLTSATWQKVLPYIAWTEEAGWDSVIVISGFTIGSAQDVSGDRRTIPVEYDVLGILSQDYRKGRKKETVRFSVRKMEKGWKIVSPDFLPPHVLAERVVRHLEETRDLELSRTVRDAGKE